MRESGTFETRYGHVNYTLLTGNKAQFNGNMLLGDATYRFWATACFEDGQWYIKPYRDFSYQYVEGKQIWRDVVGEITDELLIVWSSLVTETMRRRSALCSAKLNVKYQLERVNKARAELEEAEAKLNERMSEFMEIYRACTV